jgi:ATP-dependent RNA helicase DeaD
MEKVEVNNTQITSYLPSIYKKLEWLDREELIKKFVSLEFNRFLEYYKDARDLNTPSAKDGSNKTRFTRFFINLGSSDKLQPQNLMRLINEFTGVKNIEVGDIEILKNFSFFETDRNFTDKILKAFTNKKFKNREIAVEIASEKKGGNKSSAGRSRKNNKSVKNRQKRKGKRSRSKRV